MVSRWVGLLSARPMRNANGWQVPLLLWHASRLRLAGASARQLGVAIVASATRLDSTLSQELPHARWREAWRRQRV